MADINDLEAALRSRDAFLRLATHELRGVLSAIQLHADTLSLMVRQGAAAEELLGRTDKVTRQVRRMARQLEVVMDVARTTSGRMVLMPGDTDLAAVVRGEVSRAAEDLRRTECTVELSVKGRVVGRWDQARLEHAVEAMINRAVRAGAGPRLEISVCEEAGGGAGVELRYQVEGGGAATPSLALGTFEEAIAGAGPGEPVLELWLAGRVAAAHGGRLELEPSRSALHLPGDGTKVAPPAGS